MKTLSAFYDSF